MKDVWLTQEQIAGIAGSDIILDMQGYSTILRRNPSKQTIPGNIYLGYAPLVSAGALEAETIRALRDNPEFSKLVHTLTLHYAQDPGALPDTLISVTSASGPNLRESSLLSDLASLLIIPNIQLNLAESANPGESTAVYNSVKLIVQPYNPASRYHDVFKAARPQFRLW
ncbi:hypothetical protein JW968_03555 [Candidatus Woesearchaeota archaeon]|nr:hypothetical protein [Candidatus Woesearchaeota archaeon]